MFKHNFIWIQYITACTDFDNFFLFEKAYFFSGLMYFYYYLFIRIPRMLSFCLFIYSDFHKNMIAMKVGCIVKIDSSMFLFKNSYHIVCSFLQGHWKKFYIYYISSTIFIKISKLQKNCMLLEWITIFSLLKMFILFHTCCIYSYVCISWKI